MTKCEFILYVFFSCAIYATVNRTKQHIFRVVSFFCFKRSSMDEHSTGHTVVSEQPVQNTATGPSSGFRRDEIFTDECRGAARTNTAGVPPSSVEVFKRDALFVEAASKRSSHPSNEVFRRDELFDPKTEKKGTSFFDNCSCCLQ